MTRAFVSADADERDWVILSIESPSASVASVPRAGMFAIVRNRRGVIVAVAPSDDARHRRLHLVHIEYKDDQLPVEEPPLWELEPRGRLLEPNALPDASGDPMPPEDRRDPRVFVGTSNAGVFLVTTPADANATLAFYTGRIRAELRHARNLRKLAKRTKLMDGHVAAVPEAKDRATIYLDESGSPDVTNHEPAVFVIAAVVIDSRQDVAGLDQRFKNTFKNTFAAIGRPEDHELKTTGLSVKKHTRVLRESSLLDYQWAAACFEKPS